MGLVPDCYSRNIDINNTIIFQPGLYLLTDPATCLIHMAAIIMTAIMLWHVHSKYTAVGKCKLVAQSNQQGVRRFFCSCTSTLSRNFLSCSWIPL